MWLEEESLFCHLTKIYKRQTLTARVVKLMSDVYISGEHNTMKTRLFGFNPSMALICVTKEIKGLWSVSS